MKRYADILRKRVRAMMVDVGFYILAIGIFMAAAIATGTFMIRRIHIHRTVNNLILVSDVIKEYNIQSDEQLNHLLKDIKFKEIIDKIKISNSNIYFNCDNDAQVIFDQLAKQITNYNVRLDEKTIVLTTLSRS